MKGFTTLSLAALGAAFVIPDEQVMSQVAFEAPHTDRVASHGSFFDNVHTPKQVLEKVEDVFDKALEDAHVFLESIEDDMTTGIQRVANDIEDHDEQVQTMIKGLDPHIQGTRDHHEPNMTVYELIASSKYTTKLAALINEYPDVVELLNGTAANYTVFAPIDSAFEKIPKEAPKPSKEELKQILLYHVSGEYFPARRVLVTHTIGTLLKGDAIGGQSQRIGLEIGLKGLTVNFYDRIIAIDIVSISLFSHENATRLTSASLAQMV